MLLASLRSKAPLELLKKALQHTLKTEVREFQRDASLGKNFRQ